MSEQREPRRRPRLPAVIRLRHPLAVASFLDGVGVPVKRRLRESGLPAICEDPDAVVPLSAVWRFFDSSCRQDVPSVGWWAGRHAEEVHLNHELLARLEKAPTLYRSLGQLVRFVNSEASHIQLGVCERSDHILFYTHYTGRQAHPGYMQAQLYQLQVIMSVVRHFLGPRWTPEEIGFEDDRVPRIAEEDLPDSRIIAGQPLGYITISRDHLHKAARNQVSPTAEGLELSPAEPDNFVETLRLLLRPYLREGYPTLRFAARLMDTSSRTLERRLAGEGSGYRELVSDLRFEVAKALVCQTDMELSNVAAQVGFDDQSHFTRMFRCVGGVTPARMRRAAFGRQTERDRHPA